MKFLVSSLYCPFMIFSSAFALDNVKLTNTIQIPQKLSDKPKDRPITFKNKTSLFVQCLTPFFIESEGYVGVSDCKEAKDARYDVFSRIAWKLSNNWVCLGAKNEEYVQDKRLILRPCVINDKTQSFIIENNVLYTPDLRFMVGITNGFLTLQKSQSSESNFTLYNMQEWLDTIATPAPLMQKSFIAWKFITPQGFDLYYLHNNESIKNIPQDLYFNLENNTIAQYNPSNSKMFCLTSKQNKKED